MFSDAFLQGMRDLGYSEGKNLTVEWRYADGGYKRLAGFGSELVGIDLRSRPMHGGGALLQETTKTIPIVVAAAVDLVGAGIVASLRVRLPVSPRDAGHRPGSRKSVLGW